MSTTRTASPQPTRQKGGRFLQSPPGWMLIGIVGVGLASSLVPVGGVVAVMGAAAAVVVYWAVMRHVARRDVPEIAKSGAVTQTLSGAVIGFGLITVSMLTLLTEFSFDERPGNGLSIVASMAAIQVGAAVTEELLFRGLALQALEKMCGSWAALAITAALFGGLHAANPGATLWSSTAIAIEAGVLLGAAFLWKRSIWFVVGLHFAWNTVLGLIGIPVSGHASEGLMTTTPTGPDLVTGGEFGLEASIVPVVISVLIAIPMLIAAHRRGNLVPMRRGHR
ncbi:CPBP family intramembrane metalloprotease [Streptomyces sp. CHD11]|uniref:CPBP family intramembrane glutamic endopeptidase n=1 Tax=Streptomyces sp. CHD11 TaxID=2741325 RepID=UPI001BFCA544|nr:CPBP family intramembrane glutamic endopeptidase [Streptomyces sp. CHD11]MBT3153627.1 CPBP family intramembrane metalloprotease [Streptomyces sp. CHD11]